MSAPGVILASLFFLLADLPGEIPQPASQAENRSAPSSPAALELEQAFEALKSEDWILQWGAMSQLARWKVKEAAPRLQAILTGDAYPWLRGRALVSLTEILGGEMLEQAINLSRHETPELRAAAVEALGIIGSPQCEDVLSRALDDSSVEVRGQALIAAAKIGKNKAWPSLEARLAEDNPPITLACIRAMAYLDQPEARQKLQNLLRHNNKAVRLESARALGQARDPASIPALLLQMATDTDLEIQGACEKALGGFDAEILQKPLLSALSSDDAECYPAAMKFLELKPSEEVCDQIAALLKEQRDQYSAVLPAAMGVIARFDPDRYVQLFSAHLSDPRPEARARAVESLSQCREADLFGLLRNTLGDRDAGVRTAIFQAIRNVTRSRPPEGMDQYLRPWLESSDRWTRWMAVSLLGKHLKRGELPQGLKALGPFLGGTDKELREFAAKSLDRLGDEEGKYQIAEAQGYLTHWMLVGPFSGDEKNAAASKAYPPEKTIQFSQTYKVAEGQELAWAAWSAQEVTAIVPLHDIFFPAPAGGIAYAVADLDIPEEQEVQIWVAADDDFALWVNDLPLEREPGSEEFFIPAKLQKGSNRLLIKVWNVRDWWWYQVRVTDPEGRRIEGLSIRKPI